MKVAKCRDCVGKKTFMHKCSGNKVEAKNKIASAVGVIIILSFFKTIGGNGVTFWQAAEVCVEMRQTK